MGPRRVVCPFVLVVLALESAICGTPPGGSYLGDVNISAILDSFSVSYDKRVRPNYGGPPVEVGVTMYVLSISSVSEVMMDFTLDFYFRQFWTDPRLAFRKQPAVETLSVGSEFIKNIWVPDTFFVNEKQSYFHVATTSNEFIRIHHSGSITRSIRLTITASCPMNLQYFPMDRQLCQIEIESFGYTMRDIRYKWNEGPNSVGVSNEVSLPQFKVLGHKQRASEISLTTGNYSRLACEIQFVRSMGYYLIQIYIPSSLIVIISWVSFWLNRNATPARVSLGVTTVLTMTTLMSSTNAALPKISYVKSIDVYLGTCFIMVFASLLEYATVGYLAKRISMRVSRFKALQKMMNNQKTSEQKKFVNGGPDGGQAPKQAEVRYKVHDHKAHSKGGTLESKVNCRRDECGYGTLRSGHADRHDRGSEYGTIRGGHGGHMGGGGGGGGGQMPPVGHVGPGGHMVPGGGHVGPGGHIGGGGGGGGGGERHGGGGHQGGVPASGGQNPTQAAPPAAAAEEPELPQHILKEIGKLYGTTPSDIDKYSRIVFPVCFVCFNLMYWIIYLHISDVVADDLVLLGSD
ncbi:gamma-aminobutyric acid receptor subunit beta-like isoform X3 [Harmonia axyridis]|uniref:gamma-aminobutyric acid receptor subunit beta-like isoform X3 n=1 Tax=Harmonia axyridis TaxID=115357 RepID=UPI001E2753D1|nr:gamma-aminobutyric acid receptor subunit beta-like isoform X3 [Harmonia axyridis]